MVFFCIDPTAHAMNQLEVNHVFEGRQCHKESRHSQTFVINNGDGIRDGLQIRAKERVVG